MKTNKTIRTGILVLTVFVLNALVRLIPADAFGDKINPYLVISLLQLLVFAVPSVIYAKISPRCTGKSLRIRPPKSRHIVFIISVFCAMISGSALINYLMSSLLGSAYSASAVSVSAAEAGGGIFAIVTFALIPAVCEEFLFRGIVVAEYECSGIWSASFFSAVMFAMSHFSFMRTPVYLFSGVLLVLVLYVTRSQIASMIVHAMTNVCALFFEEMVYRVVNRQGIVLFLFAAAVIFILSLIFAFGEAEKIYSYYGVLNVSSPDIPPKKERLSFTEAILAPPFIGITVFYIIMGAIS